MGCALQRFEERIVLRSPRIPFAIRRSYTFFPPVFCSSSIGALHDYSLFTCLQPIPFSAKFCTKFSPKLREQSRICVPKRPFVSHLLDFHFRSASLFIRNRSSEEDSSLFAVTPLQHLLVASKSALYWSIH